ncbi:MAG TPA: FtsX-like permease family protein, partial [Gammaproteobacteria bacterium]|nr:FtsX-like permease family protein [Gammaproteobacteria bacterium]
KVELTEIRAVSTGYPLRGVVHIADKPFGPSHTTNQLPAPGETWLSPRLLSDLNVAVGDTINVGRTQLTVTAVIASLPDQGLGFTSLAPAALLNIKDIPATGLVGPASRVSYHLLAAGTPDAVATFIGQIKPQLADNESLLTLEDANRGLRNAIERTDRFLALAALTAVLLAGAAVALSARQFARRETDAVAILKALGLSRGAILQLYSWRLLWLGLVGGTLGLALGYGAQAILIKLLSGLFNQQLPPPALLQPALTAWATALILLAGFALPSLATLARTPPARVLRRELAPPPLAAWVGYAAALLAVFGILFWQLNDWRLAFFTLLGMILGTALLAAGAWLLVRSLNRLRSRAGTAARFGLANIARRGNESVAQMVAFGLGLLILLLLAMVRTDLLTSWQASLPPDAPNHFFINIQTDQRDDVQDFFRQHDLPAPTLYPMVRARLTAVNNVPVGELKFEEDWFIEREQNLSWSAELPAGNTLVAGTWWQNHPAEPQVSMEAEIARELGFEIGETLQFAVAGETVSAKITSLREIAWDSFQPNFFLVFSPGALDSFPASWITSAYIPPERAPLLADFVEQFPSVTVFNVGAILQQIRTIMDQATTAIEFVFLFSLAAGVVVLLAAVQASRRERRFESALLRAMGASRGLVLAGLAAEFGLLGLLSGTLAGAGATLTSWLLATQVFDLPWHFNFTLWLAAIGGGVLLAGGAGLAATWRVTRQTPMKVLRTTG